MKKMKLFAILILVTLLAVGSIGAYLAHSVDNGNPSDGFRPYALSATVTNDAVVLAMGASREVPNIEAIDFLVNASKTADFDGVEASILNPGNIDLRRTGRHSVALALVREGVTTLAPARLYVLEPMPYVLVEAGVPAQLLNPADFLSGVNLLGPEIDFDVKFISNLSGNIEVGLAPVELSLNGVAFSSEIRGVDTSPPIATPVNITISAGQDVSPDDFVTDVFDVSPPVTSFFADGNAPDIFTIGARDVAIVLEDYFGNQSLHTSVLTVLPNLDPPRIIGAGDMDVQVGGAIMFRAGVSAVDSVGADIPWDNGLSVDSSLVNTNIIGSHPVIYTAIDANGISTSITVYVHVVDIDPYYVRSRADATLERILEEGMSQVQQARAIFDWISFNVGYAADISRTSVYDGAFQAFRHRRGDCFTFYAISEVLLTRAGIPNMRVNRVGGFNRHYWNIFNPDGLGWHHFDTTPLRSDTITRDDRFMFTESQAQAFTDTILRETGERNYFVYDPNLIPEVVP